MEIIEARPEHFPEIVEMIRKVWDNTYRHILAQNQLDFMQESLNNISSFQRLWESGFKYFIAIEEKKIIGFVSFLELTNLIRIPKLYVDLNAQGKGVGRSLLQTVKNYAKDNQLEFIELNVNRYNKALYFYRRYGFRVLYSIDIPLGDFVLNDYVIRLEV